MGFIYAVALLASFCVVALPGGILAFLLGRRAARVATFWVAAAGAVAIVLPLRIFLVFRPHLAAEQIPLWSGRFALILGVPLFATALLSASGLLASRLDGSRLREGLLGFGAGLGASLPLQVLIATVWFSELASLIGLRIAY
jgi:hypothetical protein